MSRMEKIMNEIVEKRNEILAEKIIKGLESRNMTGYYAKNKEEALKKALEIIAIVRQFLIGEKLKGLHLNQISFWGVPTQLRKTVYLSILMVIPIGYLLMLMAPLMCCSLSG